MYDLTTTREFRSVLIFAFLGWIFGFLVNFEPTGFKSFFWFSRSFGILSTVIIIGLVIIESLEKETFEDKLRREKFAILIAIGVSIIGFLYLSGWLLGKIIYPTLIRFTLFSSINPEFVQSFFVYLASWSVPILFITEGLIIPEERKIQVDYPYIPSIYYLLFFISIFLVPILFDSWPILTFAATGLFWGGITGIGIVVLDFIFEKFLRDLDWNQILTGARFQKNWGYREAVYKENKLFPAIVLTAMLIGSVITPNGQWDTRVQTILFISLAVSFLIIVSYVDFSNSNTSFFVNLVSSLAFFVAILFLCALSAFVIYQFVQQIMPTQLLFQESYLLPWVFIGSWTVPAFFASFLLNPSANPDQSSILNSTLLILFLATLSSMVYLGSSLLMLFVGGLIGLTIGNLYILIKRIRKQTRKKSLPITVHISESLVSPENDRQERINLIDSFRFIHEPIDFYDRFNRVSEERFVGRDHDLREFLQRMLLSEGGTFLVTGYRGVGKTSFVNRVLKEMKEHEAWLGQHQGPVKVLDIQMNMAKPLTDLELMYHLIRSLYSRLEELDVFDQLDKELRETIELAMQRTSMSIARSATLSGEASLNFGNPIGGGRIPLSFLPGFKINRTHAAELKFAAYDEKAAEYDLLTLSRLLRRGYYQKKSFPRRILNWVRRKKVRRTRLKIIYVFDELDKLDEWSEESDSSIDATLLGLKNLFSTSGLFFIFIAGKSLQEKWTSDINRGDSVYESVFAYHKYLSAIWNGTDLICDTLVQSPMEQTLDSEYATRAQLISEIPNSQSYKDFKKYLAFMGRGIPRRVLRNFNQFVQWDGVTPYISLDRAQQRFIRFYAEFQRVIEREIYELVDKFNLNDVEERDKQQLAIYYLVDWVLRRGRRSFTVKDFVQAAAHLNHQIAPTKWQQEKFIKRIIQLLVAEDYLEKLNPASQVVLMEASVIDEDSILYRIPNRRIVEIGDSLDAISDEDNPILSQIASDIQRIGPYNVLELLGEGGTALVYRVTRNGSGNQYSLKLLRENAEPYFFEIFEQEKRILKLLNHPNIVRIIDEGIHDDIPYYVMEIVQGITLRTLLTHQRKLRIDTALTLFKSLIETLAYIHENQIVWKDIKPDNILISRHGKMQLIDPGIGEILSDVSVNPKTKVLTGTPSYMSTEQISGEQVDTRSDIYSAGIVLYEMVVGEPPFKGNIGAILHGHKFLDPMEPLEKNGDISTQLNAFILKCLQKEPDARFQSAEAMLKAFPSFSSVRLGALIIEIIDEARTKSNPNETFIDELGVEASVLIPRPSTTAVRQPVPANELPQISQNYFSRVQNWLGSNDPDEARAKRLTRALLDPPQSMSSTSNTQFLDNATLSIVPDYQSMDQRQRTQLYILEPNQNRFVYPLHGQATIRIGRSFDNDIELANDKRCSRYHAEIKAMDGRHFIFDLNTLHGTYVNDKKVESNNPMPIHRNDRLRIGDSEIRLLMSYQPSHTQTILDP